MLKLENGRIILTKGDNASFEVSLDYPDGTVYEMCQGDLLTLTVRKRPDADVILQVTSTDNTLRLHPEDTADVRAGDYMCDIQLSNSITDECYTVWGLNEFAAPNFILMHEVTK